MTVAVVALAVLAGLLGGGLVASTAWARFSTKELATVEKEKLSTERKALDLEDDRDRALGEAKRMTIERDEARKASAIHEAAAKTAREELSKYVREKLATGSDDDVAAELDRLLGAVPKASTVPDVPTTTTGNGGGST